MTIEALDRLLPFASVFAGEVTGARDRLEPVASGRLTDRAMQDLCRDLVGRMSHLVAPALLTLYRAGDLDYAAFVADFARPGALGERLPVAARLIAGMADQCVDATSELLIRLDEDRQRLRAGFEIGVEADGAVIDRIGCYKGDPHRNGRSVTKLGTTEGRVLYYKPRSLEAEVAFQRCLEWLGRRLGRPYSAPSIVASEGYGWMAEIVGGPVSSGRHYWRNAGRLAALAHLLGATDLHSGNVIAGPTGPHAVDLECMNHPLVWSSAPTTEVGQAPDITELVMSTGLLPNYYDESTPVALELCGLVARPNQSGGAWYSTWHRLGTDEIGITRRLSNWTGRSHLPVDADGRFVAVDADSVVRGFDEAMVELSRPDAPLRDAGAIESRVLLRKTNEYTSRFEAASTVDALGDEAVFAEVVAALPAWTEPFLDHLGPHVDVIDRAEARALSRLDVPLHRAAGNDLLLDDGTRLEDVIFEPARDRLDKRLRRATGPVGAVQGRLMLLVLEEYTDRTPPKPDIETAEREASSEERLLAAARVAQRLVDSNIGSTEHPAWLSATGRHPRMTGRIGVGDLYAGVTGVGLALGIVAALIADHPAALDRLGDAGVVGDVGSMGDATAWSSLARRAVCIPIEHGAPWFDVGTSGQAYANALLGRLLDDAELCDRAATLVRSIDPVIPRGAELDLMNGWAGVLAAFATVGSVTSDGSVLDRTAALLDAFMGELDRQLRSEVRRPLRTRPSVAHGANGLALALDRAAVVLDHEAAAERSVELRAGALDRITGDRIVRDRAGSSQPALATWCWGELGVVHEWATATWPTGPTMDERPMAGDVHDPSDLLGCLLDDAATSQHQLSHLCCGGAGAALCLGVAGRRLEHVGARARSDRLFAALTERAIADGPLPSLRSSRFEDPGLLAGTAGVAYGLAWSARPELVPDVLSFPVLALPRVASP